MLIACLGGFIAGTLHVLGGPDHLAALAPLSLQARRRAWVVGLRWGLGHSLGVLVVAVLALLLRGWIDLGSLSGWGERLVGGTLVLLGLLGFRKLWRDRLHAHTHRHEGEEHVHFHVHGPGQPHEVPAAHVHTHAAFLVGTLHGLAGTAHLLGVLPALALPGLLETGAWLGAFVVGTVAAMTLFAGAIGYAAPSRSERGLRVYRGSLAATSAVCALTGAAWILLPLLGVPLP